MLSTCISLSETSLLWLRTNHSFLSFFAWGERSFCILSSSSQFRLLVVLLQETALVAQVTVAKWHHKNVARRKQIVESCQSVSVTGVKFSL